MATYDDITIENIDFDWIEKCTKVTYLKRAIRVIEDDGDYYPQLKEECLKRIEAIDPTQKRKVFNNNISQEERRNLEAELEQWEESIQKIHKPSTINAADKNTSIDSEAYFNAQPTKSKEQLAREAEAQKTKGNQAIKSKDFAEAIQYYTKSINLDPTLSASYCNRALAYLKTKVFWKCLENNVDAYLAFKEALKLEPENRQINGQLQELRQTMTQEERTRVDSGLLTNNQFKRITIEEQDDGSGDD